MLHTAKSSQTLDTLHTKETVWLNLNPHKWTYPYRNYYIVAFCARRLQPCKVVTTLHDGCEVVVQIPKLQSTSKFWSYVKAQLDLYICKLWNIRLFWLNLLIVSATVKWIFRSASTLGFTNCNAQIWISPTMNFYIVEAK